MKRALKIEEKRNRDGSVTSEWVRYDDAERTPGETREPFVVMGRQGFNVRELDAKSRMGASRVAGKLTGHSQWTT